MAYRKDGSEYNIFWYRKKEPFISSEMVSRISVGKLRKWKDVMYPLCKIPWLISDLTTRSFNKKDLSKIKITNQQKCSFKSQIDYKQQNKGRKIKLFSNIKTLSDMLRMQDFALDISRFSCPQTFLDKFGWLRNPQMGK
jgi:hypothetical protein